MVNSEQFASRLQKILEFYDISAATFAEAIDVGRSSISHILSGRNKPSLDFVMKVIQTYPEVELYWLLNGKGSFPPEDPKDPKEKITRQNNSEKDLSPGPAKEDAIHREIAALPKKYRGEGIKKIILLYEDGSFEAFENGNLV